MSQPQPLPALRQLEMLVDAVKAARHSNLPAHARVKSKYSDKSANGLTRSIVDWFNYSGHFATRQQSTGQYRADLQRFVPSRQFAGMPDIYAVVEGKAIHVEIKMKDRLSDDQKEAIRRLRAAGAAVYVATDFQGFWDWYQFEFCRSPF